MEPLGRSYTTYCYSSYLTINIIVTLKCGLEVTQHSSGVRSERKKKETTNIVADASAKSSIPMLRTVNPTHNLIRFW